MNFSLWKVAAALVVGAIVWLVLPLLGSWVADLQWSAAAQTGAWMIANREIIAFLSAVAYFFWGRWYPGQV
jgi:hypothetical protein